MADVAYPRCTCPNERETRRLRQAPQRRIHRFKRATYLKFLCNFTVDFVDNCIAKCADLFTCSCRGFRRTDRDRNTLHFAAKMGLYFGILASVSLSYLLLPLSLLSCGYSDEMLCIAFEFLRCHVSLLLFVIYYKPLDFVNPRHIGVIYIILLIGCANTVFYNFITTCSSGRALMNMQFLNHLFYISMITVVRFVFYEALISNDI